MVLDFFLPHQFKRLSVVCEPFSVNKLVWFGYSDLPRSEFVLKDFSHYKYYEIKLFYATFFTKLKNVLSK